MATLNYASICFHKLTVFVGNSKSADRHRPWGSRALRATIFGTKLVCWKEEQLLNARSNKRKAGLIPHGQPIGPTWLIVRKVGSNLVANSADCAGFAVNKLRVDRHLHTVEVVGSNPGVPTNNLI